jgi:hypothetical protein
MVATDFNSRNGVMTLMRAIETAVTMDAPVIFDHAVKILVDAHFDRIDKLYIIQITMPMVIRLVDEGRVCNFLGVVMELNATPLMLTRPSNLEIAMRERRSLNILKCMWTCGMKTLYAAKHIYHIAMESNPISEDIVEWIFNEKIVPIDYVAETLSDYHQCPTQVFVIILKAYPELIQNKTLLGNAVYDGNMNLLIVLCQTHGCQLPSEFYTEFLRTRRINDQIRLYERANESVKKEMIANTPKGTEFQKYQLNERVITYRAMGITTPSALRSGVIGPFLG